MNVVVTGAASGIGCRLVTELARQAHAVLATDIDLALLERSAADYGWPANAVTIAQHDVTSPQAWTELVRRAADRFGRLDCLINVAGVLRVESVEALTPEAVALQLDVNAKGLILGTQAAAAVMVGQGRGQIINIASMAALAPVPGIAVYSASKFAVRGFSLAAAQELEPRGVHVSVVYPDAVDTPMVDYQLDFAGAALTFSGSRILSAQEVARAIVGLLRPGDNHRRPPLELIIPWRRGLLAKISTLLPRWLHRRVSAHLTHRGLARQEQIRKRKQN